VGTSAAQYVGWVMRAFGRLLSLLIAVVACLVTPGCLGELPAAAQCPSAAQTEGRAADCIGSVIEASQNGYMFDLSNLCLHEDAFNSCYRPGGCACAADECLDADDSDACFPDDDCPPQVTELYPNATCKQLSADDIGPQLTETDQCLCGCERCMQVCDGRGPVWNQLEFIGPMGNPTDPKGVLLFDVRRHMPAKGTLGLYIRARGLASDVRTPEQKGANAPLSPPYVAIVAAEGGDAVGWDTLPAEIDERFEELVLPRSVAEPYTWDSDDQRPGLLYFIPGMNTATTIEIDCIIPFIIPD
jgi:hypothetical protein